jgi:homoserine dehydrogenase
VSSDPFSSRRCRVALLGFGTVGSAVASRLTAADALGPASIHLTHIVDRRADQKRRLLPHADIVWTNTVDAVLQSDADVVVEAIGGVEPAAAWIRAALAAGKSVVTANKQVIARDGASLLAFAARQGRQLRFEAAVGGAMPIVRAVGEGMAGDRITRIAAILNGTTNAVLSRMEQSGCTLDQALGEARARGYAEADPSADLDGHDARAKLAILCALAFGLRVDPDRIPVRSAASITPLGVSGARRRGAAIRQIAHAEYDRAASTLIAWVAPIEVPRDSIFGRTVGPQNAALITGEHSGEIGIFGAGAGGAATAVAILSDIAAIARDRAAIVPPPLLSVPRVVSGPTVRNANGSWFDELAVSAPPGPSEARVLSGFSVDRRLEAEAV